MQVSLVEYKHKLFLNFTFTLTIEATWENGRLIEDRGQEQIRAYKEREESR